MNIFDTIIKEKLFESVITLSRDALDPMVFQTNEAGVHILRDSIRVQILKDIDEIRSVLPVINFYIIGSILTKNYDNKTDIDVTVQIDTSHVDSISTSEIMHLLKSINGRMAADTQHPINYYIVTDDFDDTKVEAVYDIMNDRWIKTPKTHDPDIEKWSTKFQDTLKSIDIATGELRRDLIDLDEIRNLGTTNIKRLRFLMKQKLSQIEETLKQLVSIQHNAKMLRNMAFDRFMTPQELREYGTRNHLPENILYKILERYYYKKFIKKIEAILDEHDELELTDIPELKDIIGDLWKPSQNL